MRLGIVCGCHRKPHNNNNNNNNNTMSCADPPSTSHDAHHHDHHHHHHNDIIIDQTRVRDAAGFCGTVAYVGPVASASDPSQIYAGVVWDDPSRGKHNGTVVCQRTGQLVAHISRKQCPHPTGASFVKLHKLDRGTVATPAVLTDRYVALDDPQRVTIHNNNNNNNNNNTDSVLLPHTVRTASGKHDKPIELHGELHIRRYQQVGDRALRHVSLRLAGLYSLDTTQREQWRAASQHVETLDLAGNLFSDWTVLTDVLACFGRLASLSLAANRLGDCRYQELQRYRDDNHKQSESIDPILLQTLNVRDCHIQSVQTLLALGRLVPTLTELGLGQANLTDMLSVTATDLALALPCLQKLDLSQGHLTTEQVARLAQLPALESLSLDDNPMMDAWPVFENSDASDDLNNVPPFPNLVHLQLSGTQITDWTALEGLRACPRWQSLRLQRTPLTTQCGAAAARRQLVARFGNLRIVNGSVVSERERLDAERRYVGDVARLLRQGDKATILAAHVRYPVLSQTHAAVLETLPGSGGGDGNTWKDALVTLTMRSMAAQSCEQAPLIRRLPSTLTVGKVKALLGRHFGLDLDLQELSFQNTTNGKQDESIPVLLDEDDQTLGYFGVADGATLYMHEVDVRARQEEAQKREQAAYEEKVRQQEQEVDEYLQVQRKLAGAR